MDNLLKNTRWMTVSALLTAGVLLSHTEALFAQSSAGHVVLPASAPSSQLKSRLRTQILELVPKLRHEGSFPEGADELALPMARLGDWDAARRLATQKWTRDRLHVWRAEQLALRHTYAAAIPMAQSIADSATRADSLLHIARLALDHGETTSMHAPLLAAMRALKKSPDSAQLSYAAWLWGQSGDREAARRVLWDQAWPLALKENQVRNKEQGKWPQMRSFNELLVFDFASLSGFVADIVKRSTPENSLVSEWILSRAHSPGEVELLRRWLEDSSTSSPSQYLALAFAASQRGMRSEARELRDKAHHQMEKLPLNPQGERARALYMEMMLAAETGEDVEFKRVQSELESALSQAGASQREEFSMMISIFRIGTREATMGFGPRFDVEPTQLEIATSEILAAKPSSTQFLGLKLLAQIYGRRKDRNRLRQITEATVHSIHRQAQRYQENRRKGQGSMWSHEPVEIAKILRDAEPGAEQDILAELLEKTPPIFRMSVVTQLYKNGFIDTARQAFDPLEALRQESALKQSIHGERNVKKRQELERRQISFNWDDLAAAQARYDAPEAPARWIGAIRDDRTRVQILKAWTGAFFPQVELNPPYVRRVGGNRWYRVGGSAGSSVGG